MAVAEKAVRAPWMHRPPQEPATRFAPLESKLLAPSPRPCVVVRTALVDRLRASASTRVVCVAAPAGYGEEADHWSERRSHDG